MTFSIAPKVAPDRSPTRTVAAAPESSQGRRSAIQRMSATFVISSTTGPVTVTAR